MRLAHHQLAADAIVGTFNKTRGMPFHGPTSVFGWNTTSGTAVDLRSTSLTNVDVLLRTSAAASALDQDASNSAADFYTSNKSDGTNVYGLSFSNATLANVLFTDGRTLNDVTNVTLTNANATESDNPLNASNLGANSLLVGGYFNATLTNGTNVKGNLLNSSLVKATGTNSSDFVEFLLETGWYPLLVAEEFATENSFLVVAGESVFTDYKNMYGLLFEKAGTPHEGIEVVDNLLVHHFTTVSSSTKSTTSLVIQRETNVETETETETGTETKTQNETVQVNSTLTESVTKTEAGPTETATTTEAGSTETVTTTVASFTVLAAIVGIVTISVIGLYAKRRRS